MQLLNMLLHLLECAVFTTFSTDEKFMFNSTAALNSTCILSKMEGKWYKMCEWFSGAARITPIESQLRSKFIDSTDEYQKVPEQHQRKGTVPHLSPKEHSAKFSYFRQAIYMKLVTSGFLTGCYNMTVWTALRLAILLKLVDCYNLCSQIL